MAKVIRLSFLFLTLALAGCAGQLPPSGGPVDTTPPQITRSSPSQNQTGFDSKEIKVRFDKYMVDRSVESAIYFPPFETKDLNFDWSGKELDVTVKKPFEKNRTYIFTIGSRAQDTRGNYLGKAFNIVFSTGEHVDTGMVAGAVFSKKTQSFTVAAYPATADIDTLRPDINLPRYVTQSDDSGRYVLEGLSEGKYRLICFNDEMRNFMYAPQYDLYASADHDVIIDSTERPVSDVNFMVAMEDTSRPQLYSAGMASDSMVLLKFSEPLDTAGIFPPFFVVRDSISGDTLPVDFAARLESNKYDVLIRTTVPPVLHEKYFVTATERVADLFGNPMSPTNNTVVLIPDTATTVKVSPYYFNFADSVKQINQYDTLFCQFILPFIGGHPTNPEVALLDSGGVVLPGRARRLSQTIFSIDLKNLALGEWYTARLNYREYVNGQEKDSVVLRRFMTVDSGSLGDLEGTVVGQASGGRVVVSAESEGGKTYFALADKEGKFKLDGIPAGQYTVRAWVKHGRGMSYFNGRSYPYQYAEPFGVYESKIKVRARWTTEGVAIRFR